MFGQRHHPIVPIHERPAREFQHYCPCEAELDFPRLPDPAFRPALSTAICQRGRYFGHPDWLLSKRVELDHMSVEA